MIHAIIDLLIKSDKLKEQIGTGPNGKAKIFPVSALQGCDAPYTVAAIVSTTPDPTQDGVSKTDKVTFQLTTFCKDYPKLDQIDNTMRFCIDGFDGVSCGIEISVWFEDTKDAFVDGNPELYGRVATYSAHVLRKV